eukprot:GEMP01008951.1.p1 GENE.GEMP01008951.1~~GEMP01008951.1.p1  ORF type:complete len:770 (+),score=123.31 GEMP01008951.1:142-2451(+)
MASSPKFRFFMCATVVAVLVFAPLSSHAYSTDFNVTCSDDAYPSTYSAPYRLRQQDALRSTSGRSQKREREAAREYAQSNPIYFIGDSPVRRSMRALCIWMGKPDDEKLFHFQDHYSHGKIHCEQFPNIQYHWGVDQEVHSILRDPTYISKPNATVIIAAYAKHFRRCDGDRKPDACYREQLDRIIAQLRDSCAMLPQTVEHLVVLTPPLITSSSSLPRAEMENPMHLALRDMLLRGWKCDRATVLDETEWMRANSNSTARHTCLKSDRDGIHIDNNWGHLARLQLLLPALTHSRPPNQTHNVAPPPIDNSKSAAQWLGLLVVALAIFLFALPYLTLLFYCCRHIGSSQAPLPDSARVGWVEGLRFLLCTHVVVWHYQSFEPLRPLAVIATHAHLADLPFFTGILTGAYPVVVFFILSGIVLAAKTIQTDNPTPLVAQCHKRVLRLVPTAASVCLMAEASARIFFPRLQRSLFSGMTKDGWLLALFLKNAWVGGVWTLIFELAAPFCLVILYFVLPIGRVQRWVVLLSCSFTLACSMYLYPFAGFVIGYIIAELLWKPQRLFAPTELLPSPVAFLRRNSYLLVAIVALCAHVLSGELARVTRCMHFHWCNSHVTISAASLVALVTVSPALQWTLTRRPYLLVSRYTFTLYLVHQPVKVMFLTALPNQNGIVGLACCLTISLVLAIAAHHLIEVPAMRLASLYAKWIMKSDGVKSVEPHLGEKYACLSGELAAACVNTESDLPRDVALETELKLDGCDDNLENTNTPSLP